MKNPSVSDSTSNDFTIRPVTESDYEFAKQAHHAAYFDVVSRQFGSFEITEQDKFFDESWNSATHEIIMVDGEAAGYYSVEHKNDSISISSIEISPDFQGRGIGTGLLQTVIKEAESRNVPISLQVFRENNAVKLYKKLGFKIVEETDMRYKMEYR